MSVVPLFGEQERPPRRMMMHEHGWIPFAETSPVGMETHGERPKGWPEGVIIMSTGGRGVGLESTYSSLGYISQMGYNAMVIAPCGTLFQSTPLHYWGKGAGTAKWKNYQAMSPSFLIIEIENPGRLMDDGSSHLCEDLSEESVFFGKDQAVDPGHYVLYTPQAMKTLKETIKFLYYTNPMIFDLDNVVGFDEVSEDSRSFPVMSTPGGSLGMHPKHFRANMKLALTGDIDA